VILLAVRVLCLDVGDKRIGIAVSDPSGTIAQAVKVYTRGSLRQDVEEIGAVARDLEVSRIIVGLPRNLDGSLGTRAQQVLSLAEKIESATSLPVESWDERFSSNEAHRIFDLASVNQKKRKRFIDMMAAQIILQGYLDARKNV
jgi:putative holliday junction resolvase